MSLSITLGTVTNLVFKKKMQKFHLWECKLLLLLLMMMVAIIGTPFETGRGQMVT